MKSEASLKAEMEIGTRGHESRPGYPYHLLPASPSSCIIFLVFSSRHGLSAVRELLMERIRLSKSPGVASFSS